jgi:hypothetical protein
MIRSIKDIFELDKIMGSLLHFRENVPTFVKRKNSTLKGDGKILTKLLAK